MTAPADHRRAFTLLELLVVVALVSVLSFFVASALGPTRGAVLQSGQSTLANLLVVARTKAAASGRPVRLLLQVDASNPAAHPRFLRHLVLQVQADGTWQSVTEASLPSGVYLMPGNFAFPDGLFAATDAPWIRSDGSPLRSTALRSANLSAEAIYGGVAEQWVSLPFAAAGTTNAPGDLVLALGRGRAPGSYAAGESPIELENPEQVRGLSVSAYGVATLVNSRASF